MNRSDIRHGVEATVEPLSEITRAAVWQRIEDQLSTPVRPSRWIPVAAFAAGAAVAAAVAALVHGLGSGSAAKAVPAERIVLVAPAPAEYHRAFAGGELTVYGPAELELDPTPGQPAIRIQRGTVIMRRAPDLPALEVSTPEWSRSVRDTVVAVRVTKLSTEIASGDERARVLVERDVHALVPGTDAPAAPVAPIAPAHQEPRAELVAPPPAHEEPRPAPDDVSSVTLDAGIARMEPVTALDGSVAPVATVDAAPIESLTERYARAERAIANGDRTGARQMLEAIARDDPSGRIGAVASYDLALLLVRLDDPDAALHHLERVLGTNGEPSLHAPAQRLRCRIQRARGVPCRDVH